MSRPARTIAVALLALIGCGLSILSSAETTEPLRPAGVSVTGKPLGEAPFTLHRNAIIGPHDGVLSTAFFRDLVLQIDYPSRVVRF